ncbi:PAAR-like protein [Anaeromicropila populeti]|uniref:DUF4280 domain-containing protein n=1 Tax=Anaeromicropila populeti TaxID=37658 RepID=A0A1I6K7G1_9FIRM|nr:PAAR-like protein [Anaeromicropila populeti]SFR87152.1 protein of unknown function [Anaeromicropila populeti]
MADNGGNDGDVYLVRGAMLTCSCGSHPRRINLPVDHGVTVDTQDNYEHPLIHEKDCMVGPTANIDYFGVCNMLPKNGPTSIVLKAVDESGNPTGGIVQGGKCVPVFPSQKWNDTQNDVRLSGVQGDKLVTTKSCLMCALGGKVTPKTSGVEYKGELD